MMDVNECFEKGLLKEEKPDAAKAKKSIDIAKHKLEIARSTFEAEIYEETIVNAYSAMFHAGRSLLFKDGVSEKSHYALYVYLKEKYSNKIEARFVNELNSLRLERHELQYGLEKIEIKEVEAEDVIAVASDFIKVIEKLIK